MNTPLERGSGPIGPTESLIGRLVGRYRILAPLGEGGMGTVYLAEHETIGRKAAIKVLNPTIVSDREAVSRFFVEARAVSQIKHPNIVDISDFSSHEDQPYIVMEYLEGETLADRFRRQGVLEPESAFHIMRQVTSGLSAVHHHGMVHRDLKPANIFLCNHPDYPDFAKILDFGIAKLLSPDAVVDHKTRSGALLGTPQYMSPEQCLGEADVDGRSDIYSLGIVLFLILTGELPFQSETLGQLILSHVALEPPRPEQRNPKLSRAIGDVVMRALAKRREQRFPNMAEFRDALDQAMAEHQRIQQEGVPVAAFDFQPSGAIRIGQDTKPDGPAPEVPAEPTTKKNTSPPTTRPSSKTRSRTGNETTKSIRAPFSGFGDNTSPERVIMELMELVSGQIERKGIPLPTITKATATCLKMLSTSQPSFDDLADALLGEPILARRIVHLANNPVAAWNPPVAGIRQAISRLGTNGLQRILIEMSVRPLLLPANRRVGRAVQRPWHHALASALLASRLACSIDLRLEPDVLYMAALLRPTGILLVIHYLIGIERDLLVDQAPRHFPEDLLFEVAQSTYLPLSTAIARAWPLPNAVGNILQSYDQRNPGDAHITAAAIVRLANRLAESAGFCLRQAQLYHADQDIAMAKSFLGLSDADEQRVMTGLKTDVARLITARR